MLEKIKEKKIDKWNKEYINRDILDGDEWTLEIHTKNLKHKSFGMNSYPKNYYDLISLLDFYGIPVYDFEKYK